MNRRGGDPLTRSIRHWGFLTISTMLLFGVGLATTWAMFRAVVNDVAEEVVVETTTITITTFAAPPIETTDPTAPIGTVTTVTASPTSTTSAIPDPTTSITDLPTTTAAPVVLTVAEQFLIAATNDLRVDLALSAVSVDATLDAYAGSWAMHMAVAGAVTHSDIDTLLDGWTLIGENVVTAGSADSAFAALVTSPAHYEVLVNPGYTDIGVGVVQDEEGAVWVAQVLGGDIVPTTVPSLPTTTVTIPEVTPPTLPEVTTPTLPNP
jgi:uncharacterized protein YkwD